MTAKTIGCTLCGAAAAFTENSAVYGRNYGEWPWLWLCTGCGAYVGVHAGSDTPLGTFADRPTRQARIAAHAVFDPLWKEGHMSRGDAYGWLAEQMGIATDDCHIGRFDKAQCEQVYMIMQMHPVRDEMPT